MSERAESMLVELEFLSKMIRTGELRSFAWVGVSTDGTLTPTAWNLAPGDALKVLTFILTTDLVEARDDEDI
jgi:hypothetical protein